MTDVLVKRDQVVHDLSQAIRRGDWSLESVPALLRRVLTEDMWKERLVEVTGEVKRFETWAEFVQASPPEGLGTTERTLRNLCRDDAEIIDLLDRASQRPAGRPSIQTGDNVTLKPGGNAAAQALRRLRKDRPDLHARVLAGELSPHRAMVDAGFRRRTVSVPVDEPRRIAATLRRHLTTEQLAQLRDALQ